MFVQIPVNKRSLSMRKKVYGMGINDSSYQIHIKVDNKQFICPFYKVWQSMLMRCYNPRYQSYMPTYIGCIVCIEWLYFSKFRSWMCEQNWKGKQLDKDILIQDNKVYSPENCIFVTSKINSLMSDHGSARGFNPIGVCYVKRSRNYMARVNSDGASIYLGHFTTSESAHEAWVKAKKQNIIESAQDQQPNVKKALLRAANDLT